MMHPDYGPSSPYYNPYDVVTQKGYRNPTGGGTTQQGWKTPLQQGPPTAPPMPFQRPSSPMQTFAQPAVQPQNTMAGFGQKPQISNYNPNLAPGAQHYRKTQPVTPYNPWAPTGSPVGTISMIGSGWKGNSIIGGGAQHAGLPGLGQTWGGQSNFFANNSGTGLGASFGRGWSGQSSFFNR